MKRRNVGIVHVRVGDLLANEQNWREHGIGQREALAEITNRLGWYGYPDVYQDEQGNYVLIDGHLRREHLLATNGQDAIVACNLTDFTEEEATKALLTKDPLSAMAGAETAALRTLLTDIGVEEGTALGDMLRALGERNGLTQRAQQREDPQDAFEEVDAVEANVKIRQLFFGHHDHERFHELVDVLRGADDDSTTKVVYEALRRAADPVDT